MYKPLHFDIEELVGPQIRAVLTEEACWRLFPEVALRNLDAFREEFNAPIWINGRGRIYSGVRPLFCPTGAIRSAHKLVRANTFAVDAHASDLERLEALARTKSSQYGIVRMENPKKTPGWRHLEFTSTLVTELDVFDP